MAAAVMIWEEVLLYLQLFLEVFSTLGEQRLSIDNPDTCT